MTTNEQKRLMHSIFMTMMTGGQLSNQQMMAKILKGVYVLLGSQEGLSTDECDNCLLYFFQDYSKGCSRPLPDSYIKTNMIPIVKNFGSADIAWGASLITAAKMK